MQMYVVRMIVCWLLSGLCGIGGTMALAQNRGVLAARSDVHSEIVTGTHRAPRSAWCTMHSLRSEFLHLLGMPAWEPGGQHCAVLATNPADKRDYVVVLQCRDSVFAVQSVMALPVRVTSIAWLGKQHRLVLGKPAGATGPAELLLLDLNSGKTRHLATGSHPVVSQDGDRIVYKDASQRLWNLDTSQETPRMIPDTGADAGTAKYYVEREGNWSATERAYVFLRGEAGKYQVLAFTESDRSLRPRVIVADLSGAYATFGTGWLDQRVLFGRYGGGNLGRAGVFGIFSSPLTGGSERTQVALGDAPPPIGEADWLGHGKVGYPADLSGNTYAMVDTRTGKSRLIRVASGSDIATYSFDPEGVWLAVLSNAHNSLLIVNCSTGHVAEIQIPAG